MRLCVLTFTVDRPADLARCIESVLGQQGAPPVRHLILSERASELASHPRLSHFGGLVEWVPLDGAPHQGHASARMASLRQAALGLVAEPLVCFLDDDNTFEPDHLASLAGLIESAGLDAAHSWRRLFHPDGTPFDGSYFPWHPDPRVAAELHAWCVSQGILEPGSDVVRDGPRQDPDWRNVATVDMNEWLFRTEVLRAVGFETRFTDAEASNQVGEDDKLLARLRAAGVRFGCSGRPTVRYHLGGVSNRTPRRVSVARRHGLGNVLLLLPVLRTLLRRGDAVELVTRPEWGRVAAALLPGLAVAAENGSGTVDLDEATRELPPAEHRTDELARILGVAPPLDEELPEIPEAWKAPFQRLAGGIVLAPEASHPARRWPEAAVRTVAESLRGSGLYLTGMEGRPDLPCDHDFRGRLTLEELFGLVAVSRCVISMDSATLHVARLAGTPCVAIFGGIDPAYRLRVRDRIVALSAELDCCPCNKRETCEGRYDCLAAVSPQAVLNAVEAAGSLPELLRVRV